MTSVKVIGFESHEDHIEMSTLNPSKALPVGNRISPDKDLPEPSMIKSTNKNKINEFLP